MRFYLELFPGNFTFFKQMLADVGKFNGQPIIAVEATANHLLFYPLNAEFEDPEGDLVFNMRVACSDVSLPERNVIVSLGLGEVQFQLTIDNFLDFCERLQNVSAFDSGNFSLTQKNGQVRRL